MSTTVKKLQAQLGRRATMIDVGKCRPPDDPSASWFGRVNLGLPGEPWPEHVGRPMLPIAQLNLREAPYVPAALADIALIAVFLGHGALGSDAPNGDGWLLRAYPRLEELTAREQPDGTIRAAPDMVAEGRPIRALPITYRLLERDLPDWDDVPPDLEIPEAIDDEWYDHFGAADGCKLGGWPSLIQSEISWAPYNEHPANPEFVFQLESVAKANFVLLGEAVLYFGRGTGESRDIWTLASQCM